MLHRPNEGQLHAIKHKSNQPQLMKAAAWLSWQWSAQQKGGGGNWVASNVVSSWFVVISYERSKQWCSNWWSRKNGIPNIEVHKHEVCTIRTAMFNIQQLYVLPTPCIYGFCVDLRTKSDYFPVQH